MTDGFILQTTPTLGGTWGTAPGSPVLSGGIYSQSVPLSPAGAFFRRQEYHVTPDGTRRAHAIFH